MSIERVQKTALRIILRDQYSDYNTALQTSGLEKLSERHDILSLNFAKKCLKDEKQLTFSH